jgi:hypothetical protein
MTAKYKTPKGKEDRGEGCRALSTQNFQPTHHHPCQSHELDHNTIKAIDCDNGTCASQVTRPTTIVHILSAHSLLA